MMASTSQVPAGPNTSAEYSVTRGAMVRMMSATVVPCGRRLPCRS